MIGLVTADVAAPLDPDLLPLDAAMRARLGDDAVSIVSWDDASIDWGSFAAVIIRSPWDYTDRLDEFLQLGRSRRLGDHVGERGRRRAVEHRQALPRRSRR